MRAQLIFPPRGSQAPRAVMLERPRSLPWLFPTLGKSKRNLRANTWVHLAGKEGDRAETAPKRPSFPAFQGGALRKPLPCLSLQTCSDTSRRPGLPLPAARPHWGTATQLRRAPVWIALGSVNTFLLGLLLPAGSSLFMALACFPACSFPCVPQSAVGLTDLWEPFHSHRFLLHSSSGHLLIPESQTNWSAPRETWRLPVISMSPCFSPSLGITTAEPASYHLCPWSLWHRKCSAPSHWCHSVWELWPPVLGITACLTVFQDWNFLSPPRYCLFRGSLGREREQRS